MKSLRLVICLFFLILLSACSGSDGPTEDYINSEIEFPATVDEIERQTSAATAALSTRLTELIHEKPRTFENTIIVYDRLMNRAFQYSRTLSVLSRLVPDPDVRQAANKAVLQWAGWSQQISNRAGLYTAIMEFKDKPNAYSDEQKILLARVLTNIEELFHGQEQEQKQQLLTRKVELKQSILSYQIIGDPDNKVPALFAEFVNACTAVANLNGWDSQGSITLSRMMATTPEAAKAFVQHIADQLVETRQNLWTSLTEIKRAETENPDAEVYREEIPDYLNIWIEKNYGVPYLTYKDRYFRLFDLEDVLMTLTAMTETVFGIDLIETPPPVAVWDDSVRYFQAFDHETGDLLGNLYMDLYAREGKQETPMVNLIRCNALESNPEGQRAVSVLILNLFQPQSGSPTMLSMMNTRYLFHEFGHALHNFLASSTYYYTFQSGTTDFVELHSQLLEHWVSEPAVIALLLGDNPDWKLETVMLLVKMTKHLKLIWEYHTIATSMIGLDLFSNYSATDEIDPLAIQGDIMQEYLAPSAASQKLESVTQYLATLGGYYGYLWSQVIAADITHEFWMTDEGILNPELGRRLRETIYTSTYDSDPEEQIRSFLNRGWSDEAYLNELTGE